MAVTPPSPPVADPMPAAPPAADRPASAGGPDASPLINLVRVLARQAARDAVRTAGPCHDPTRGRGVMQLPRGSALVLMLGLLIMLTALG